ncbi:hypothetical protein [Nostoc linckia]|uniref:hypothetical protein n=1 Tax=Nostoc linckia TaxID=92942 RepID=UPI00117C2314|nr:hypothetical protein [Nostoc linckia]
MTTIRGQYALARGVDQNPVLSVASCISKQALPVVRKRVVMNTGKSKTGNLRRNTDYYTPKKSWHGGGGAPPKLWPILYRERHAANTTGHGKKIAVLA